MTNGTITDMTFVMFSREIFFEKEETDLCHRNDKLKMKASVFLNNKTKIKNEKKTFNSCYIGCNGIL